MTQILKQSTAVDVLIGPFVDLTDGATSEVGESPTVKLSKNGQALAAKNDITTPVHDADGYYNCELDATDTNTVGTLVLTVAKSATALPVRHEYQVIEEAIYDALIGASAAGFDANQRVDVGKWLGTAVTTSATTSKPEVDVNSISDDATAANNAELFFDGTGYAGGTTKLGVNIVSTDDIDLSATQKASVNAEVDTALATTTYAEPGQETPGATVSLSTKIGYIYKFLRNRVTSTSTTISVYNDDGTTVGQKYTHSDAAGTYDRGELTTGP